MGFATNPNGDIVCWLRVVDIICLNSQLKRVEMEWNGSIDMEKQR